MDEKKLIDWILAHPELFYKGVPLVFITYLSFPALMLIFSWLPWIWTGYGIYKRLPPDTVKLCLKIIKIYFDKE